MGLARAGRVLLVVAIWMMVDAAPARAQTSSVLEGGFRLRAPENGLDAAVFSMGPVLLTGARHRSSLNDGGTTICQEIIYLALGAKGTKRAQRKLLLRQPADVLVFSVFYTCDQDLDEVCVRGASRPVAVSRCSALLKLTAGGEVSGKLDVRCRDGLDPSDAAFGLPAQQVAWLDAGFPNLRRKFALKVRDTSGEEVTGQDLKDKIQNLDLDALDDVVGTYLADDNLPACP